MKLITSISAGFFTIFLSCAANKENGEPATPLYNTRWALEKIHTPTGVEAVQTKAFIKLDPEKKSAGGNGSCNSFGGSAAVNNNNIRFTDIFSTKMYCEAVQKTEDAFLNLLGKVDRFEIKDKTLLLYQDKELLLELVAE